MSVEWCPMGEMTGDLPTKRHQGSILRRFRDLIMVNIPQIYQSNGKQVNRNKIGIQNKFKQSTQE